MCRLRNIALESVTDGQTDRQTDRQTDGRTESWLRNIRFFNTKHPVIILRASRITKFTRGPSVASYLHEKQTSRIQSLSKYVF